MKLIEKFISEIDIDSKEFYNYIMKAEDNDIHEFIKLFNDIIEHSTDESKPKAGFNFIANSTLSGLPFPCEELPCRLENLEKLARNAILYADTVYIQNPFRTLLDKETYDNDQRLQIIDNLIILHFIKPLLTEGIFKFAKSSSHFCHECYKKFQKEYLENFERNLDVIEAIIEEHIYQNVEYKLIVSNSKKCVEISGNNDLLEHPIIINFRYYVPKPLDSIEVGSTSIKLEKSIISQTGLQYYIINDVIDNLTIQDYFSKYYSAHVLTNREFDLGLLQLINSDQNLKPKTQPRSEILSKIDHFVPYIDKISLKKLIKLRKDEGEAFQVYRDKLNKLAKVNANNKVELTDYFQDEIRPELNKINLTIKNGKKLLWGNVKSNIVLATTYISASLFSGILPSNIDKIVASIGGFDFSRTIGQDLIKIIKNPAIRENELYFLWKLYRDNKIRI